MVKPFGTGDSVACFHAYGLGLLGVLLLLPQLTLAGVPMERTLDNG